MITQLQKNKILQVINVFETGSKEGKYDTLVTYPDGKNGTRQITYGRSQTTEQGNLKALIEKYIANKGLFANDFKSYVSKIGKVALVDDADFKKLLKRSAKEDIIMRTTQDEFFDVLYYQPALHFFEKNLFTQALSMLVIYDSYIHSGSIPSFLRERFPENVPLNGGDEKKWIKQYVDTRHKWLINHSKKLLQKTAYRTKCLSEQISNNNWDLSKPINANGTMV
ncbi:chitosanase [Chryseobacterium oryctis]|uniref:Chitosanase n=1 Tax=Chryseobacterium oryctis TaxID=2952618 RepID=A0ABT3HRM7_9FLAO|nr:chitosanase [Chryseobacterium oryctis]MCW3162444.1 chitosanase [Chryseobacterium oryctis]